MSIAFFVARVWRYFSLVALVLVLLFTYRGLPDIVAVHFGANGKGDGFLPKEQLFYLVTALVVSFNILVIILLSVLEKISVQFWRFLPNKEWLNQPKALKELVSNWLYFLLGIVHTIIVFVLRALLMLNDDRTEKNNYTYLFIIAITALLVWFFSFPLQVVFSNPQKQ